MELVWIRTTISLCSALSVTAFEIVEALRFLCYRYYCTIVIVVLL